MYILVHHSVTDPNGFWDSAQQGLANMPAHLQLHHTLSAKDGSRATCLWEADSVDAVRDFLEPLLGANANNEYREAENRDGIAVPAAMQGSISS
ncbi:MAG: hypothetical protein WEB88_17895 [Gemmatimonadota bacterium]